MLGVHQIQSPAPQAASPDDTRTLRAMHDAPRAQFYVVDDLQYPNTQGPVTPGNGDYASAGCGMIRYGSQPKWSRGGDSCVGPVLEFFRSWAFNNRTPHT